MGDVNLQPVQNRGNKTVDEYLFYIANHYAMTVDDLQNILEGRLSSANIRELTADKIITGTLLAQLVTIMSNLSDGAYIRIDGNGMVINDGTKDVFSVDIQGLVTMTGAVVQSASGYPKLVMDPSGNLLGAYFDEDNYISLTPNDSGAPAFNIIDGGFARLVLKQQVGVMTMFVPQGLIISSGGGDVEFYTSGGDVLVPDWANFRNVNSGSTLQAELNDIWDAIEDLEDRVSALENP